MLARSVQVSVSVPSSLADAGTAERARVLLVLDGVRSERLTWRTAADFLGMAPDQLLDLARAHGIAVQRVDRADLAEDAATLDKLLAAR